MAGSTDVLRCRRKTREKGETPKRKSFTAVNLHGKKDGSEAVSMGFGKLGHDAYHSSNLPKPGRGKVITTLMKLRDEQRSRKNLGRKVFPRSSICNPRAILRRLTEKSVVLPGTKVYYDGGKSRGPLAEGWITCGGIKCSCCNGLFTLTRFEAHAGSKNHRPATNIFLEDGRSIADCQRQMESSNKTTHGKGKPKNLIKRNSNQVENCDTCCVCHVGGELICCDHCSCSFHRSCLGLKDFPLGYWFCPLCCCGFCGEGIFQQRTEHSADDDVVRTCYQCEHKFHVGCARKSQGEFKKSQSKWFCSGRCEYVFCVLHELIGKPFSLGLQNLTWRILKSLESDNQDANAYTDSEFLTKMQRKLNVAVDVMHECFEPAKDPVTGRDLVEDVIFNRRLEQESLNYGGFYTVVLEKKGNIVSVATVRIYEKVAELPFVATRFKYRRRGMCRLLMGELEKQLVALGVESLVLPSAPSVLNAWTTKFGFKKMTNSERSKYLSYTFLDFQDTIMCRKLLMKPPSANSCFQQATGCHIADTDTRFDLVSPVSEVLQGGDSE